MSNIEKKMYEKLKWNFKELFTAIIGACIFSIAVNIFIMPNNLYNGGVLGISQLVSNLVNSIFKFKINIVGMVNFLINLPLFIIAYRKISKTFFFRTIICVIFQTIFLTFIPIPEKRLVDEVITSVLIGGVLAGIGSGLVLSTSSTMGGTDIVSIAVSSKNRKLSVGMIGASINVVIFSICGILYGVKTMIYSIIYTVFGSMMVDKFHIQNISSTITIFTKKDPKKIVDFVLHELDRDVTTWEAIGTGTDSKTYICYVVLSKYEESVLESHIKELDKDAFMVRDDGVAVIGNFKKRLAK